MKVFLKLAERLITLLEEHVAKHLENFPDIK